MSLSFPPNPSIGQTYSSNGRVYKWSGVQWTATAVPTSTTAPVYVSVSPPPAPIQGSLWYDTNNSNLNIWYVDLNGGQWVSVVPFPVDAIDQNGGVFTGPIYAQYEIPNNPSAFITVGYFDSQLGAYLTSESYIRAGNGINIDPDGLVTSIDCGILV